MSQPSSGFFKRMMSGWGFSWGGLIDNRRGEWWLFGQLFLIAAHLTPPFPGLEWVRFEWPLQLVFLGICLFFVGILIAIRAFFRLGPSLSPLPDPKPGAELVLIGSYEKCRHPLYQGLLISSFGVTLYLGSLVHLVLFISLAALLIGKARREERKLLIAHPGYKFYIAKTPAIISWLPFLDWRV